MQPGSYNVSAASVVVVWELFVMLFDCRVYESGKRRSAKGWKIKKINKIKTGKIQGGIL